MRKSISNFPTLGLLGIGTVSASAAGCALLFPVATCAAEYEHCKDKRVE